MIISAGKHVNAALVARPTTGGFTLRSVTPILALGVAGSLLFPVAAIADDVTAVSPNFITSGGLKTLTVVKNSPVSITMDYEDTQDDAGQNGDNGCNLTGPSSSLTLNMTPTYGASGSVFSSPLASAFTFNSCGDQSLNLTAQNTGEATFDFSVAGFATQKTEVETDDFNVTGMTFKLIVVDPEPELLDADGDGIADEDDNCPGVANADQADADADDLGNLCDANSYAPAVKGQAPKATGDEGSTLSTGGAFSDADGDQSLTLSVPAGTPGSFTDNGDGTFDWTLDTTDNVSGSVTVTANDGEHTPAPMTFGYAADNVDPTVDATTTAADACTVQLNAAFTDPGTADTHTASIAWGDGVTASVATATSPVSASHAYASNGTFTATVTVTDDDNGVGADTAAFETKLSPSQILQPINANGTQSAFKTGSTIPVKIRVTGCDGTYVADLTPTVSLGKISKDAIGDMVTEDAVTAPATNGLAMRWSSTDLQYIYNLSTKAAQTSGGTALAAGEYRVRVTDPRLFTSPYADFFLKK